MDLLLGSFFVLSAKKAAQKELRNVVLMLCGQDPRFSLHALRHAAASLFIEQGWPPKKIQTMLGHSSITMTYDVYGHLFHDSAKDVDLMGEMERGLLAA